MNKILIVEDDVNIQNILAYNLEKCDYKVFTASSGYEALEIIHEEGDISLVLMDVMMPQMNGFDCTLEIRKFSNIPILMLTALESESDILKGFDCGVDDYIVKPFSIRQVIARVNSHFRKKTDTLPVSNLKDSFITINDLTLNTLNNEVVIGSKKNILSDTEFNLLMFFYQNPNKVFDRETLMKEVWGTSYINARTVDISVHRLREKVELSDSDPQNIKTKRGKGYYLELR